jgi:thiamine biosynthesis lipoprotein
MMLAGFDRDVGEALLESATKEIDRLEALFSLQRPQSAIRRLNRDGFVVEPDESFGDLINKARDLSLATHGAFDPTVQPLWTLWAGNSAPTSEQIESARSRVGFGKLQHDAGRIFFSGARMALTLNGIAQGYITDHVMELLKREGAADVLVNVGEYRAIGHHPEGRSWTIGIRNPHRLNTAFETVALNDAAVSTSAPYGYVFDATGMRHHLFDTRLGRSTQRYASVSVKHPSATVADGLSTGFASMSVGDIAQAGQQLGHVGVLLIRPDGTRQTIGAWPT